MKFKSSFSLHWLMNWVANSWWERERHLPFWCIDLLDGYVTFVVSILMIGVLTAAIGDLASHLGCTIGLLDSVNAIAFVALGTSVPGKLVYGLQ